MKKIFLKIAEIIVGCLTFTFGLVMTLVAIIGRYPDQFPGINTDTSAVVLSNNISFLLFILIGVLLLYGSYRIFRSKRDGFVITGFVCLLFPFFMQALGVIFHFYSFFSIFNWQTLLLDSIVTKLSGIVLLLYGYKYPAVQNYIARNQMPLVPKPPITAQTASENKIKKITKIFQYLYLVVGSFYLLDIVLTLSSGNGIKATDLFLFVYSALAFIFLAKFNYRFLFVIIAVGLIFGIGLLRNVYFVLLLLPTDPNALTKFGTLIVALIPLSGVIFYLWQVFYFSKKEVRTFFQSYHKQTSNDLIVPRP